MNSLEILGFLGKSPENRNFDQWLQNQRIYERPHSAEDDDEYNEDPDAALRNARESEIDENERHSIALIYEDIRTYQQLFDVEPNSGDGDFVLKQVAFYGPGISNYQGFAGALPFELEFQDSPASVHKKLGAPIATRVLHELSADLWVTPEWHINVSYAESMDRIAIVHVRKPNLYDLRMIGQVIAPIAPAPLDLEKMRAALGKDIRDAIVSNALAPLGWDAAAENDADGADELFNFVKRFGLTLYFRQRNGNSAAQLPDRSPETTFLAGFRANRAGDMRSQGFHGRLPFGLQFHHTPEQVLAKIQTPPDERGLASDTGYFIWNLNDCRLHVMYSLIDWQIYRVTYFTPFAR